MPLFREEQCPIMGCKGGVGYKCSGVDCAWWDEPPGRCLVKSLVGTVHSMTVILDKMHDLQQRQGWPLDM